MNKGTVIGALMGLAVVGVCMMPDATAGNIREFISVYQKWFFAIATIVIGAGLGTVSFQRNEP